MPYIVLDPSTAAAAPTTVAGAPLTSVGETLLSLRTELAAELAGRSDVTPARLNTWINYAYRNITAILTIKELFASIALNIVAGQPLYLLPIQVAWIKRLGVQDPVDYTIWGGRELNMIDETTYRSLPTLTGEPRSFFRSQRMVVIYPTPIAARVAPLDFRVRVNDLVNDTDSPLLPIEFHVPILLKARVRGLRALLNYKDAAEAQNDFVSEITPLLNTDAAESENQYGVVQPMHRKASLFRTRST